jgi:hypothetical protein
MPREGTKAAEIMRLYAKGLSTSEIAKAVGCNTAYVRVVARQRRGNTYSAIDRRYRATSLARETQKTYGPARNAYHRVLRKTGDYGLAREAYRQVREQREATHA